MLWQSNWWTHFKWKIVTKFVFYRTFFFRPCLPFFTFFFSSLCSAWSSFMLATLETSSWKVQQKKQQQQIEKFSNTLKKVERNETTTTKSLRYNLKLSSIFLLSFLGTHTMVSTLVNSTLNRPHTIKYKQSINHSHTILIVFLL